MHVVSKGQWRVADGELRMEDGGRRLRKGGTEIAKGAAHSEWKGNTVWRARARARMASFLVVG